VALRLRVVDFVGEGHTHRSIRVSIKFANDMVLLKRATDALGPKPPGHGGWHGTRGGVAGWIGSRIRDKRDLTLDERIVELRETQGIAARRIASRFGWSCATST
jgi:hypothetical protein